MIETILGKRYRILEQLGEGAMGQVFLAEHLHLGRKEAIKILRPEMAINANFVSRFRREARATNRVHHPNIVSVYDFGQLPDGRLFLAMEYADGLPLDRVLRTQGPLPVSRALHIVCQLALAVEHAHSCGVIHRDLKPPNLILVEHRRRTDVLKVLDFGMAKILGADSNEGMRLTGDGDLFGTPAYMAPEILNGVNDDPRSDLYAIGCILFEVLVGETPFIGRTIELFDSHINQTPDTPSARRPESRIPPVLDEIVAAALAKDPDARFQTAAQLFTALSNVPGFTSDKPGSGRRSRTRTGVTDMDGWGDASTLHTRPDSLTLGDADTVRMNPDALQETLHEITRELARRILDEDVHVVGLRSALSRVQLVDDDTAQNESRTNLLDVRERELERAAREREGSLRFAIGELQFDVDREAEDVRPDVQQEIVELERRLRRLVGESDEQLSEITNEAIAVAVERGELETKRSAAYAELSGIVSELVPQFENDLSLAALIDHYQTVTTAITGLMVDAD